MDKPIRLHRFIAQCGVTSRRKAEELILEGRVAVNGKAVTTLGTTVTVEDQVFVDGELVQPQEHVTLLLFKPRGYITSLHDPYGRKTVMALVPPVESAVKPVGRLDQDTEGLLLFTSDGDLAARLTHARYGIEKEYEAKVRGQLSEQTIQKLSTGVHLDGRKSAFLTTQVDHYDVDQDVSSLRVILNEGRYRQVRRMFEAVGHPVVALTRTRIAFLSRKGLRKSEVVRLGKKDTNRLRRLVGLAEE